MELYLQLGYGMMDLSRQLIQRWGGGTVVLSPRDLTPKQMLGLSAQLIDLKGRLLIDPQFYLPRADHERLNSHDYWPNGYDTKGFSNANRERMLNKLSAINREAGADAIIVPGERAVEVNDLWINSQNAMLAAARNATDQPLIVTICLSSEAIRSSDQVNLIVEQAETQHAAGYYLVLEHPGNDHFVVDPQWLANSLDLTVGLRRLGSKVIVGYANQQQLIMACAAGTAIASGNWGNVRSFFPGKFQQSYQEDVKKKAVWYYCPLAFSEYKLPYLDVGVRLGLKAMLFDSAMEYARPMIDAPLPSASGWSFPLSFLHYLDTLRVQTGNSVKNSFRETLSYHRELIEKADVILRELRDKGVRGQNREFTDALDASRAALVLLESIHGPILERNWPKLTNE